MYYTRGGTAYKIFNLSVITNMINKINLWCLFISKLSAWMILKGLSARLDQFGSGIFGIFEFVIHFMFQNCSFWPGIWKSRESDAKAVIKAMLLVGSPKPFLEDYMYYFLETGSSKKRTACAYTNRPHKNSRIGDFFNKRLKILDLF